MVTIPFSKPATHFGLEVEREGMDDFRIGNYLVTKGLHWFEVYFMWNQWPALMVHRGTMDSCIRHACLEAASDEGLLEELEPEYWERTWVPEAAENMAVLR